MEIVASATALGFRVAFLAELGAALAYNVAKGVRNLQASSVLPQLDYKQWPTSAKLRTMGGHTGDYQQFFEYAKDRRREQCLKALADFVALHGLPGIPPDWPPRDVLHPHAALNGAAMWFWAKATASSSAEGVSSVQ